MHPETPRKPQQSLLQRESILNAFSKINLTLTNNTADNIAISSFKLLSCCQRKFFIK
ncbi:hypothetical protein MTBBW1_600019 [Desulfamplus magnetovallimortis]|uniref:Uncharacterized protein n=1 Tax=Desulfamplus magnetovallimortis TaxID=1246637 RepID=A0A1W1HI86_9BACT|nr:hypothetical protein MTBBW1_600019 [Desulfamplus magnetovallimortis]